jgi:dolichol-phosphate mannosyltransferase
MEDQPRHKPLLSVVVPVYCEQAIIPEFYRRTKEVLAGLTAKCEHEMIFVNDGSMDKSWEVLKGLRERDEHVKLLNFSRNFGHQIAITAGMDHAAGDAVVIIDSDLQDPPEVIPQMLAKWEEGYKVVYGVRSRREGETAFKLYTAKAYYRILERLSDVRIPVDTGDFRLLDRAVVETLRSMREDDRYMRGLVAWVGFPQCGVPYERDARHAGETKYSLRRMVKFAFDGITSFSDKPLYLSSFLGIIITLVAFVLIVWSVVYKLVRPEGVVQGWTSLLIVILFLGGLQLFSLGIMGQYIGRIYRGIKQRPLYVVGEKSGFQCPDGRPERTDGVSRVGI